MNSVRAALSKIEGVKKVEVDLKKETAKITLKERAEISKETVAKAIEGTKFKVTDFKRE